MEIANNILELIGNTPMVKINKLTGDNDATVLAKLEWYNIGGSVKDRMALYLIRKAEKEGRMNKNKTILEATSGNTGIALAMIATTKGYKITIVMPESVTMERRKIINAYGAELILSPATKGTGGAVELKQKMIKENPDKYIDINQFKDPANILAHYETTGKEILEQTNGKVDMIVVGVGTAGTGVGISKRVKEFNPDIKIVGIMPKLGVSIQGLRNPKELHPTQLFNRDAFDEIIEITQEEMQAVFDVTRKLSREEGLFVGVSSGAAMYIALKKAKELGKGKNIVVIFADRGDKYLSTEVFK
jgi:cysteine synthase